MRFVRILLVVVAVACFGVALSYPIRYKLAQRSNNASLEDLAALRRQAQSESVEAGDVTAPEATEAVKIAPKATEAAPEAEQAVSAPAVEPATENVVGAEQAAEPTPETAVGVEQAAEPTAETAVGVEQAAEPTPETAVEVEQAAEPTPETAVEAEQAAEPTAETAVEAERAAEPTPEAALPEQAEEPEVTPTPAPTVDRLAYDGPLPYPMKEKVLFDESKMLPELRDIYELNHDLIGWLTIPGTIIDYPVVQAPDSEYYLEHDFYGRSNMNGQIILDSLCDPYTPSYNMVISGHHMKNGSMFGDLPEYRTQSYWEKHRFLEFDSLMERKQYVIFAVFYSADYDEDEEGFRYNANIEYLLDAKRWLAEIEANKLYDTGIDVEFGDEFITLTTCDRARHRNGRFVVVCRRIREGETFE